MSRALCRILLTAAAFAALLVPSAHASSTQLQTIEAPRDLLDPATRAGALDQIDSLGTHALRVVLYWRSVAPSATSKTKPSVDLSDPANYAWGEYDALLAAAKERGWPVILTVSGPVPKWATKSKKDYVTYPSAKEFETFMTALGRHYADQVSIWSVWNEPNHPDFLMPQYTKKGHHPVSGKTYRRLFLAAWRGLRASGNGRDPLLMGETAPRGTGKVVAPLAFLRQALCLDSSYRRTRTCANLPADGYAHHSYSTREGPFFVPPGRDDVTMGVLRRLTRALDLAARAGAVRSKMPLYLDEFGVQSFPDKLLGVPLAKQAEYYAISEKLAYDNSRVRSFSQYLLRDDPKDSKGSGGGILSQSAFPGFESGLELANGKRKPAYDGYRLPLTVTERGSRGAAIWGRVRPASAATSVTIQYRDRGGWRTLRTLQTASNGTFRASTTRRTGRRWRVLWTAPDGTRYHGASTRAYPKV
jgi:hypothetical protein